MKESMATFIRVKENQTAFDALHSLFEPKDECTRIIIYGPRFSGKTTLLHGCASDLAQIDKERSFVCTGSDIAMALSFEADDSFFERLGSVPTLFIDNLELLMKHEKGEQLLALLVEQRAKYHLDLIIASDIPLNEYKFNLIAETIQSFDAICISPLNDDGKMQYVVTAADYYRNETSPTLGSDAIAYIATKMNSDFNDIEVATRYLMIGSDFGANHIIDANTAAKILAF